MAVAKGWNCWTRLAVKSRAFTVSTPMGGSRIITHEVDRPNGLVVTANDKLLFVADNNNSQGGARKLWRFELTPEGTVNFTTQTLIYDWGTTRGPDGMKLDVAGNLYVAAGLNRPNLPHETADPPTAGIYVFSPTGKLLDFAPIPRDETTNCGFGGGLENLVRHCRGKFVESSDQVSRGKHLVPPGQRAVIGLRTSPARIRGVIIGTNNKCGKAGRLSRGLSCVDSIQNL